jgi:hypothetical protein
MKSILSGISNLGHKQSLNPTTTKVRGVLGDVSYEGVAPPVKEVDRMDEHWQVMHGWRGNKNWAAPFQVTECDQEARPGYASEKHTSTRRTPKLCGEKWRSSRRSSRKARTAWRTQGQALPFSRPRLTR